VKNLFYFRSKVPAYTLMETIITLVIIGIVIYLTYSMMIFLDKELNNFKNENLELSEYALFNANFEKDLFLSNELISSQNKLQLIIYSGDTITYKIGDNKMIRLISNVKEPLLYNGTFTAFSNKKIANSLYQADLVKINIKHRGEITSFTYIKRNINYTGK